MTAACPALPIMPYRMVAQEPSIFLGRGVYPIAEAARLTKVKPATVRAWLRGRQSHGVAVGRGPLLHADYGSADVLSYLDLIEVLLDRIASKQAR